MSEMPMFPLGGVLLPSMVLPLHVFEPRYRELVRHCLASDREFGVTLIERGSEVGGGDLRTLAGTVARIAEASELDDGRWTLLTTGVRRIRVERWLEDAPYPRAEVVDWPDEPASQDLTAAYSQVVVLLRRVLGLLAELNEHVAPVSVELVDDPQLGSYQVAAVGPFGPADRQSLLEQTGAEPRLEALRVLLGDEVDFARRRLSAG